MIILLLLLALVAVLTFYIRHHYTFWQRKGFPVADAGSNSIPFGCMESVAKRQRSLGMAIYDVYKQTSERFVGIYLLFRPAILVRDIKLARQIMVQDFASFQGRGVYCDEKNNPFSGHLFALKGDRWRTLRNKLTPSFSSGKLKGMFGTIEGVGTKMVDYLDKIVVEKEGGEATTIEIKQLLSTYAIDIVGSVIFGLEGDSFKDPNSKLRAISEQWDTPNFGSVVRSVCVFLCPVIESIFVRLGFKDRIGKYMIKMVNKTVEFREKNNITRKDIMQTLIQLRNTGKVNLDDNNWDIETASDDLKLMSVESIAGHASVFYVAGFESTSATTSFTMFELAQNREIYAKAQQDIEQAIKRHDGKITYDSIQEMKYLDLCLMETVRKYPALPILNRECTKDFPIPDSDKVIEKGTPIVISLFGIHRDPQYFPDPLKYDPERFLESKQNYNPVAYMPFGDGPRHCIAQRLGKINTKVALAKLMTNYDFDVIKKGEIEIDNFSLTIMPKGGVNLKLRRRNK